VADRPGEREVGGSNGGVTVRRCAWFNGRFCEGWIRSWSTGGTADDRTTRRHRAILTATAVAVAGFSFGSFVVANVVAGALPQPANLPAGVAPTTLSWLSTALTAGGLIGLVSLWAVRLLLALVSRAALAGILLAALADRSSRGDVAADVYWAVRGV
jgi:hypothetical protein